MLPHGDLERGAAEGFGDIMACDPCAECWYVDGIDMERSEVGVPSSTAEVDDCGWLD